MPEQRRSFDGTQGDASNDRVDSQPSAALGALSRVALKFYHCSGHMRHIEI